jgi:hypothetical protein
MSRDPGAAFLPGWRLDMRRRDPQSIVLRTGGGVIKAAVPVVCKLRVGLRSTHNGDGRFLRSIALGEDGIAYETKSRGGGWREAVNQQQALDQIARLQAKQAAEGGAQ